MTDRRPKLLISESAGFSQAALQRLRSVFDVRTADLDRDGLMAELAQTDVLWVRLRTRIDADVLDAGPNLRVVATNTTGLNHIDLDECERRGVQVLSLKGEVEFLRSIRATAEHTLALTLALLRNIPAAHRHVCQDGEWDRSRFQGKEIHRKTVGIIGYGRLGRTVARYFEAFGAEILVHSRDIPAGTQVDSFAAVTLPDLLRRSDIVSLHVNYEPENDAMLGADAFGQMKNSAVFINTARGELVDEQALVKALRTGQIAGAAIDVVRDEQAHRTALQELRRLAQEGVPVVLTPHIGGNTAESLEQTEVFLADRLCAVFPAAPFSPATPDSADR